MADSIESSDHVSRTGTGNCWHASRSCKQCGVGNLCDVCHKHDQPRGECEDCIECKACEQESK